MPSKRSASKYRSPTSKEASKILYTGYQLHELYFPDEIEDFMAAAKRRIMNAFHAATEPNPRYKWGSDRRPYRRTDNYIIGVGGKPSDLVRHVQESMRPFINTGQLPEKLQSLSPQLTDKIIARAQRDVLLLVAQLMRHHEVWYDEATGLWQICQSSMDEFHAYRRKARSVSTKLDDRSYHGRVRSQSKARGIPEGVSVGFA